VAGASYAGYTLFGRHASLRFGAPATAVYSAAGACLLLAVVLPVAGMRVQLPVAGSIWALLALYALLTIAVATALFYHGLGRIEADRASIVTTAEPLVAALLATILLDQGLTAIGWLGLGLVVASVSGAYASGTRTG
jgi:DME family drug/metabolite transporter